MNVLNKKCEENLEQVYGIIKNMKKVQITLINKETLKKNVQIIHIPGGPGKARWPGGMSLHGKGRQGLGPFAWGGHLFVKVAL